MKLSRLIVPKSTITATEMVLAIEASPRYAPYLEARSMAR